MKKISDKNILYIIFSVILVHMIIWIFTGITPFSQNPYNSYVLQAEAWKHGMLDIGKNYSHLEIAIFNGKYFISFPQFPAMVYFPFVLLSLYVPEGVIALICAITGAVITYKILCIGEMSKENALLITLLATVGSNILFVSVNAWVWFIAQNMCYTLTSAAILCALRKKYFLTFFLWSFAVGCRPFQVLYFPLLCAIVIKGDRLIILKKWYMLSGAAFIALLYMWLNYARFGNIFEFGHNYLPEFTESENGQFSIKYLIRNLYSLIRLPIINNGVVEIPHFNGMNVFLVSPVFAVAIYCFIRYFRKNTKLILTSSAVIILELICIALHKTMGGWHFGNRYTNDCLPAAVFIISLTYKNKKVSFWMILLTLYAVLFNAVGTALFYINP